MRWWPGITKIDGAALESFVAGANIVIAHNAAFDRKFAERFWPLFEHRNWACSATGIDWQKHGFGGVKLPYLLTQSGSKGMAPPVVIVTLPSLAIYDQIAATVGEAA
jgi:DNA polymerase-3 subunit epsilon